MLLVLIKRPVLDASCSIITYFTIMNTLTIFPIIVLSFFAGTGPKRYEHSYHTGGAHLMHVRPDQKTTHAKCQLDFTIVEDSLIFGQFGVIDPPADWNKSSEGTFHGVITKINSNSSFGGSIEPGSFEWETVCPFDSHRGAIKISKVKGKEHFYGRLDDGSEVGFILE
jgi:hypothetical protein